MGPWSHHRELEEIGLRDPGPVHWNLRAEPLCALAARRGEGTVAHLGPISVRAGRHDDPAADHYLVREPSSSGVLWWGAEATSFEP